MHASPRFTIAWIGIFVNKISRPKNHQFCEGAAHRLTTHLPSKPISDPKGPLLATDYYPMSNGRSFDESISFVTALRTSDEHSIPSADGWQPGDQSIVQTPATTKARLSEGNDYADWYFCNETFNPRRQEQLDASQN